MDNSVPEGAASASEGVRSRSLGQVQVSVRGDRVVVLVVVGLDSGAGHLDEGVGVVEEAGSDGGVVDPRGGRKAA